MSRFSIQDLQYPIIAAPMAAAPSTPKLAAAVTNAGGLGFLAGGLVSVQALADSLTVARRSTSGPLGVNLFVPQPFAGIDAEIKSYAATLTGDAERYGVVLGEPRYHDDDWLEKLDVVCAMKPDLVSFTFGLPNADVLARIKATGITSVVTVTSLDEAMRASAQRIDALVVQGSEAGGHSATFDPLAPPAHEPLQNLLAAVTSRCDVPAIAAGGLATEADLDRTLRAGAVAAQFGTAFLLADEAGTSSVHRAALTDAAFTQTSVTRAFTGRYARALRNRFIDDHDAQAVAGFPNVAFLTGPVLAAAAKSGDPHGTSLWAGTAFRRAWAAPAADIVAKIGSFTS